MQSGLVARTVGPFHPCRLAHGSKGLADCGRFQSAAGLGTQETSMCPADRWTVLNIMIQNPRQLGTNRDNPRFEELAALHLQYPLFQVDVAIFEVQRFA